MATMVPQTTFNIHGTFPLDSIMERGTLLKWSLHQESNNSLKNCSPNGSLGNPKWFLYGISAKKQNKKNTFGILFFKSV